MSPVRGFHHHFPQSGGLVQHSGPSEACDEPGLGPLTDGILEAVRSLPPPANADCPTCRAGRGYCADHRPDPRQPRHDERLVGLEQAARIAEEHAERLKHTSHRDGLGMGWQAGEELCREIAARIRAAVAPSELGGTDG